MQLTGHRNVPLCESFTSIDGEGKRAGMLTFFIRLHGCNLNCSYCDSAFAVRGRDFKFASIDEIADMALRSGVRGVTLTGGEPLLHESSIGLLHELTKTGMEVNVETNGSIPLKQIASERENGMFFTMDVKTPSSGMSEEMCLENLSVLLGEDVVKFVVGDTEDLKWSLNVLRQNKTMAQVFFSPVFGKIEADEIVRFLKDNIGEKTLERARVQVQLHKIIWNPDERGV